LRKFVFINLNRSMDTYRQVSIFVGVLIILGTISGILSIAPAVDDSKYLVKAGANSNRVLIAAFFQFIMTVAYLGIAIALYSILKQYNERLALGFLSFRIVAAVFILIGVMIILLILKLSQEYLKSGSIDSTNYDTIGKLLLTGRDFVNHIAMILALSIGGIMLYIIMIQSGLIPNWLSIWGLAGSTLSIIASFFVMFRFVDVLTPTYIILNLPMAIQDLTFAIWLLIKGFNNIEILTNKIGL
jgi:hypothetical protein